MPLWKSHAPLDLHTCTLSPSDAIVRPQVHACVQFHYTLWSGTACSLEIPFEKSNVPSSEQHLDTNLTRSNGTPQRARLGHQQLQPVLEHILSNMSVDEELVACIPLVSWIGAPPPPPPLSTSPTSPHWNTCTHLYLLVHLVSIDATGIQHEMERAVALKDQGGKWFAREEWARATSCYKEALRAVLTCKDLLTEAEEGPAVVLLVPAEEKEKEKEKEDQMKITDIDDKEEKKQEKKEETKGEEDSITAAAKRVHDLRVKCHLNIASCHMNGNKPLRTISRCNLALDLCPHSIVGLLRRSKAYFSLQMYDDATSDLDAALSVEPGNVKVGKFLRKVAKAKKDAQAAAARR